MNDSKIFIWDFGPKEKWPRRATIRGEVWVPLKDAEMRIKETRESHKLTDEDPDES